MKIGDLVYNNIFGEDNSCGIILSAKKLPKDANEFYSCSVLLSDGTIRNFFSSQLLTEKEMDVINDDR